MTRRPMLDEIEGRADSPWLRERRATAAQEAGSRLPVLAGPGCWCGRPAGHGWPGKNRGEPHPR